MISFFKGNDGSIIAVGSHKLLQSSDFEKLIWLFSGADKVAEETIIGQFIGPRKEMISPWSTNATDIVRNAGIQTIYRIEKFETETSTSPFDPMLQQRFDGLDQTLFTLERTREAIAHIEDIEAYNKAEGLALSQEEVAYLNEISATIGRPLTDSEVFGFSQINSEHCRHKIFNGTFILDGQEQPYTLFQLIKKTSQENPNYIVSAYKDNVAFIQGPEVEQFAPKRQDRPDWFESTRFESVIALKAETHNFPTTVEPFNGAATGSGGEIRDRMAGGQGSIPLAGTAVYMTSYPRLTSERRWEKEPRKWYYQSPQEILTKASNGASDYGNKFGQPLICGSILTFEHEENDRKLGFDKVIMLAGGIGFGKKQNAKKKEVSPGEKIIVMGGDNYRIGMGGGAVSSLDTGVLSLSLEFNAIQRSNPEMQKRVANAVRAMVEMADNSLTSIHDHGAGGHLNCLSELVEETGGTILLENLPVGDKTLSAKEILSNESQERMGVVIEDEGSEYLKNVAKRERTPYYEVGTTTDNQILCFSSKEQSSPFDLKLDHLFGSSPKTILKDYKSTGAFAEIPYSLDKISTYLKNVLRLEAVACKDWLTNKVDRCVTGKVATQPTCGELQLPLNNVAVMAIDYSSKKGIATAIGHAPIPALIDPKKGSKLSIAEALTNLVWTPLTHGLKGVSLSANWMWPAKNEGEDHRLYQGVKGVSDFSLELGINVPTGKDSLSMTQKYDDGEKVYAPGTVIISSIAEVDNINSTVSPVVEYDAMDTKLYYIDFSGSHFELGGSSFAQTQSAIGTNCPDVDSKILKSAFAAVQEMVFEGIILAGHDISAGGLVTTLLEMTFANSQGGLEIDLSLFDEQDMVRLLFSEKPAVVVQSKEDIEDILKTHKVPFFEIGSPSVSRTLCLKKDNDNLCLDIDEMRQVWFESSALLDLRQTKKEASIQRSEKKFEQPLSYTFPFSFDGRAASLGFDFRRKETSGVKAAIIREQGVNSDREMAYALWLAGFDVKDVHMTDLIAGREDLSEVNMIVFVGGFSNSDVLGAAKGWAGSFLFNKKAKASLDNFYARRDTLSLGVCNGCQLMMELEWIDSGQKNHPKMYPNSSGKFECAFISVDILETNSVFMQSLAGSRVGIWLAHGEGRFEIENTEHLIIPVKYAYEQFPANPNGSTEAIAALSSKDGRHLAMMPHLERSLFPWNWPYKKGLENMDVSPWMLPFRDAFNWVKDNQNQF